MEPQILLYVVAFVLSCAFSAFFAGSETALVSLGRIDLQAMREKGDRRGALIRSLRANTSRLLAVILIGQNLFLSAASASATTISEKWFGAKYGVLAAVIFSTLTLFIFAEMMPKAIAAASPAPIARAVAVPLWWMVRVLSPIAEVCVGLTRGVLRILGVKEVRPALTEEELKSVFNLGAEEGVIHREEKRLLHNVIEFGDKTVRDLMIPRTKIVAVPETASFLDVKMLLREHKFSRLPVYRGSTRQRRRHPEREGPVRPDGRGGAELPARELHRFALPRSRVQARRGPARRDAAAQDAPGDRRRRARRHGGPGDARERRRGAARARSRTSTTRRSRASSPPATAPSCSTAACASTTSRNSSASRCRATRRRRSRAT